MYVVSLSLHVWSGCNAYHSAVHPSSSIQKAPAPPPYPQTSSPTTTHLQPALVPPECCSLPLPACNQLERSCADLLTCCCNSDDHTLTPATVGTFQCCTHHSGVPDALKPAGKGRNSCRSKPPLYIPHRCHHSAAEKGEGAVRRQH